jgi:hypothetical protein
MSKKSDPPKTKPPEIPGNQFKSQSGKMANLRKSEKDACSIARSPTGPTGIYSGAAGTGSEVPEFQVSPTPIPVSVGKFVTFVPDVPYAG